MSERPKFFDDLAGVAGGAISALAGLREELAALVRARVDEAVRRLDLVKREEFDAMAELAQRAKTQVEALEARVAALELPKE
jgi:BMFP domain-containing protein YqiC